MTRETRGDFVEFYSTFRDPIRRGLVLAIGNTAVANEAIDEAMTRAFARWDIVSRYDKPEGWVFRVGLNWAFGVFRKRRYEVLGALPPEWAADPVNSAHLELLEALAVLSARLRPIVVARYLLDWSIEEVAIAFGIPQGTVKSRLSRALSQLAVELGTQE